MDAIVDRERQVRALTQLSTGPGRKLALLYGRRRVGKTFLLTRLWPRDRALYFTASATTPEINRQALIQEAAAWSGTDLRPEDHPTWRTVFRSLLQLAPERDLVVIIDEFQYLAHGEVGLQAVASELNAVWEGPLQRRGGLLLVLSGSAVRTLEALRAGGSALHGRLDWSDRLRPFDYFDAGRMVQGYAPIDRLRTYAAFGGVPSYLASIDASRPLDAAIVELLFEPHGRVRLQLATVIEQEEGLRETNRYRAILRAIGTKRRAIGAIAAHTGEPLGTPLRRMVERLVDIELLEGVGRIDAKRTHARHYRIADPALRMYYGLVAPFESAIEAAGAERVWRERVAPEAFPAYAGLHVFEDIVAQAYRRFAAARGLPGAATWGSWTAAGHGRARGQDAIGPSQDAIEIDVAARTLAGTVLTGSLKMRRRPADVAVVVEHVANLRRLADAGIRWARDALRADAPMLFVSTGGFTAGFRAAARGLGQPVTLWDLHDLFPEEA